MKSRRIVKNYSALMNELYPELHRGKGGLTTARTITFQVTEDCNLKCSYCYQVNKRHKTMSLETAKKFIDLLLTEDRDDPRLITADNSPFVIIEFIGGEPLLQVDLIDKIITYFKEQTILLGHPWATRHIFCITSNGTLYFDEKVNHFLHKYANCLSFNITVDGSKELHDSCRVFEDGTGSYDIASRAALDWMAHGHYMGSKITIAPQNVEYLADAIVHMAELGYKDIFANTVYEKGWELHHAREFYNQCKIIADYLLDNNLDDIYVSLFDENAFVPLSPADNNNWCGGTGAMLACDPEGNLYPCIRYMPSSLGDSQPPLIIGNVDDGMLKTEKEESIINCLNCITRRSQSTDECFNCKIARGCAWCSGYNYQIFGTADKRATYICEMHKARSLANAYYFRKLYKKENIKKTFEIHCTKEWAIPIIGEKEYEMLMNL